MIAVAIIVASVFAIGGVLLHALYTIVELKGYERGLTEAEGIFRELEEIRGVTFYDVTRWCKAKGYALVDKEWYDEAVALYNAEENLKR